MSRHLPALPAALPCRMAAGATVRRPLLAAVLAVLLVAPANAASMQQCESGEPAARIAACGELLVSGGLDAPQRARAMVGRGQALLAGPRDVDAALADFTAAAQADPSNADAFIARGKIHFYRGEMDAAFADFSTAVRLAPGNPMSWNNLGKVYYNRNQYAEALKLFDKALEVDSHHANSHLNRADALYHLGRLSESLAEYERAMNLYEFGDRRRSYAILMIAKIKDDLATN